MTTTTKTKLLPLTALVAAISLAGVNAVADTLTWIGGNDDDKWSIGGNWSGETWVDGSDVVFDATGSSTSSSYNTVTVDEAINVGTLTVTGGTSYTFGYADNASLNVKTGVTIDGNSSLTITGGTNTFSPVGVYYDISLGANNSSGSLTITGGTNMFSFSVYAGNGSGSTGTLKITGGTNTFSKYVYLGYNGGSGSLTISNGENTFSSAVYVGFSGTGELTIKDGENKFSGGDVYVGRNGTGTMTIEGGTNTFSSGTTVYVGYASGSTGKLTIKGGENKFSSALNIGHGDTGTMTIEGGNNTFLGDKFYVGDSGTGTLTITDGENTFSSGTTVCVGYNCTGYLTIEGGTTTFSGSLNIGNAGSSGTMTITGGSTTIDGTLTISSTGSLSVSDSGLLTISNGLTSAGTLSVGYGATLSLSGTIDLSSAIANSGTVTVSTDVTLVLNSSLAESNTYTFISGSGSIENWSSLTVDNFVDANGNALSHGHTALTLTDGSVTVSTVVADLVWNGTNTDGGNIWTTSTDTQNWLASDSSADYFANGDNVTFGAEGTKSVTIVGTIEAGTVTVTGTDYTFSFNDGDSSLTASSLTIDGGSLSITGGSTTIEGAVMVASNSSLSISGGTITLSSAISNSGTVTVSDNVVFVLDNLTSDGGTYTIISGGSIEGWTGLTKSNFSINGSVISGRSTVDVTTTPGQVTVTFVVADLVWNGTSGGNNVWTNNGDEIWLNGGTQDIFIENDNVTFADVEGVTKEVTISGEIVAGSVTVTGSSGYTFTFSDYSSLYADTLTIDSGASLKITGTGTFTVSSASTINGSLTIGDGTDNVTTTFESDVYVGRNGTGTLTIEGGTNTFGQSSSMLYVYLGYSSGSTGNLTITGGKNTFSEYVYVGYNGGTGNLTISGETNNTFSNSVYVGYYDGSKGTITIEGGTNTFSSSVSVGYYGSSTGTLEIKNGTNIFEGTVIILGESSGSTGYLTIEGGTNTFSGRTVCVGDGYNCTGKLTIEGGTNIFESTVIIGEGSGSTGYLTIEGGTNTFSNSVSVGYNGTGTMTITGGETTFSSSLSVSSSTLTLSGGTITLSETISNSGTVTVSDNVVFVLDNLTDVDGTYTLISGEGEISGWTDLTKSNFSINGSVISGRSTVDVETTPGQVTVTFVAAANLVWNGTDSSNVWTNNGKETWLNGNDSDAFVEYDNVTFGTDGEKNVSVVGAIEAGSITVTGSGYTFTFSDYSSLYADTLTIDSGASLEITGSGRFTTGYSASKIDGELKISGGEATFGDTVYVGASGTGSLTIGSADGTDNVKTTFSGYVYLAHESGSSGSLTISGGTTTFSYVYVGEWGKGELTISGGTTKFSSYVYLGYESGSSGSLTIGSVNGTGGETTFVNTVYVGYYGTGEIDISGGSTEFKSYVYLGCNSGSSGSLTITGGTTTFSSTMYVGYRGNGTMEITAEETTFRGDVRVGEYGKGELKIASADGTDIETTFGDTVHVGCQKDSSGTITIGSADGTGGERTTFSNAVYIGDYGTGSLTIYGGTTTFSSDVRVGYRSGSSGSLTIGSLDGTSGETTFGDTVYVGDYGTGTMEIGSVDGTGGETTFKGWVEIGYKSGSSGSLTISGGTTTFNGREEIGYESGSSGSLTIYGGETNFKGDVYVGCSGTGELTIYGGTTTFSSDVRVGEYGKGELKIASADGTDIETTFGYTVHVGCQKGSSGTMEIGSAAGTGGEKTTFSNAVYIGDYGTGELTIYGGETTFKGDVRVSYRSGSSGSLTIGSADDTDGETTFEGNVYLGYESNSSGSLTISGGTTTFKKDVYVGSSGTGTMEITGGETTLNGVAIGTYGSLTISGGTASVTGSLTSTGSITVGEDGSLSLTGGTITLSSAISNSGTVTVSDNVIFVLDNLTSVEGTYTLISGEGEISGWDDLTNSNFQLKGIGRSTVNVSEPGQVTIEYVEAEDLVWNGTDGSNVWTNNGDEIWLNNDDPDVFVENDNVTFADAEGVTNEVTISGEITAGTVTVTGSDYTFTLSDNSSVTADSLMVTGDSASLKIEGSGRFTTGSSSTSIISSGSLLITDNVTTTFGATVYVSASGSLTITGGSTTFSGAVYVGDDITESTGSLTITGGTTTFSGTVHVGNGSTGSLTITGGTTTFSSSVIVTTNSSLSLTGGTITLSNAISNSGTVTVTDNVVFVLDNLTSDDGTYTIISGGNIEGWDDLTKSNFQLKGKILTGRSTVDVSVDGQVTVTTVATADLVWNGTAGSNVWTNDGDQIWLNDGSPDAFVEYDNVTFADVNDVTKEVTISGEITAGSVTVTGSDYTFTFSDNSSLYADSLRIEEGASLEITNGETTINSVRVPYEGTLKITNGETTITDIWVFLEGTLKISGGTTTADRIEVDGTLEITNGETTITDIWVSHEGTLKISGGTLNVGAINSDGSISFGDGLTVNNLYETTRIDADITLSGTVTFNAEYGESIDLNRTISGSGKLVKDGDGTLTLYSDNTYSGGTTISSGTVVAQSTSALGTGAVAISDNATLELSASGTFSNATSGNGTLSITNNATVSFGADIGVKNVNVTSGATLSGATTLTHSNAQLILDGNLALDVSAGETVSFTNGGTVTLGDSATLTLSGISAVSPTSVIKPLATGDTEEIGPGSSITIFSGATIEGDLSIEDFLKTDSTLKSLADRYAIVYDPDKGLSVTVLESGNVSSITSGLKLHDGIGSDFISAIISDEDLQFDAGLINADDLNPIVKALVAGNTSEASKMMNTLAPDDYAAMVAMPTTSFYNDVKAIDNRLAARRGPIDENARWEFFAQAQGTFVENDDASDTQTFDFDLYGVLAGADYRVNEGLTVGVTVGYDYGKADIHNSGGKIESDDVRITIFAGQQIGEIFFVNAGAQVGYGHYDAKRKTALGHANGDTDGWNAGLFADVGMMLTLSEDLKISARPYVGLAYLHSEVSSFDDNLFDIDDFHGDSLRASIGCGVFWGFDLAETAWSVGLDASYSHDFCGDEVDIDGTCMGTGRDFGITAKALSKNIFSVGPVVSVGLTESISAFAGYAFQAGTDSSTGHNLNAGLKVTF